jgi:hypothetical protein
MNLAYSWSFGKDNNNISAYLWTSVSTWRLVISQVKPWPGSSPGCDISSPWFLINSTYLQSKQTPIDIQTPGTIPSLWDPLDVLTYNVVIPRSPKPILNPKPWVATQTTTTSDHALDLCLQCLFGSSKNT